MLTNVSVFLVTLVIGFGGAAVAYRSVAAGDSPSWDNTQFSRLPARSRDTAKPCPAPSGPGAGSCETGGR